MPRPVLQPLDIKCTATDCKNNLHCFLGTKKMVERGQGGRCRDCGADLVDWSVVHQRDQTNASYTIKMLEYELIRHHFWHVVIDERAINYARRKGWLKLRPAVENRIRKSVGAKTAFDGRQTPRVGNPIFYAQHATATCCRRCIEEWHGIPQDQPLSDDEVSYMTELCMLYLEQRLPQLTEYGEKVPALVKKRQSPEKEGGGPCG